MKKLLPLLLLVLLFSCKKDDPEPDPTTTPPVTTSGCNIDATLSGTWISDSIRSWGTDSLGIISDDTVVAMTFPTDYLEYSFYCIENNPFGWDPDTMVGPTGWKDRTYLYYLDASGGGWDPTSGLDPFYYGDEKLYFSAPSIQDTAGLPFFALDLSPTSITMTGYGPNNFGGNAYTSVYYTKQ